MANEKTAVTDAAQKLKEAYFTASQGQLIWSRFRRNRMAMVAGMALLGMILLGAFAPFFSPYDPTIAGIDKDYRNGPPQMPMFCDHNGCSARPFLHTLERKRSLKTLRWETTVNTEKRRYVELFVEGWEYRYGAFNLDLPGTTFDIRSRGIAFTTHLFGNSEGGIHVFGTDGTGEGCLQPDPPCGLHSKRSFSR